MNTTVVRSLSGIVFLAVMIGCLLGGTESFTVLVLFIQGVMMQEFYRITMADRHKAVRVAAELLAFFAFGLVSLYTGPKPLPVKYFSILLPLLVGLLIWMVVDHKDFKEYAYVLAGLLYIGLPLALSPFVVSTGEGGYSGLLMLAFFIIIWSSDVGAYCFGMLFGQKICARKSLPRSLGRAFSAAGSPFWRLLTFCSGPA